jgi:ATP-dependent Clp protease ATP-binding subunit ClpA
MDIKNTMEVLNMTKAELIEVIAKESEKVAVGARTISRNITKFVKDPITDFILNSNRNDKGTFKLSWNGENTTVSRT